MKQTPYIGSILAAGALALGVLAAAGELGAADGTKPTYKGYRPRVTAPNANDHHANYHADYSGRPAQPKTEDGPDRREDARRFQDGERGPRAPYGWRR